MGIGSAALASSPHWLRVSSPAWLCAALPKPGVRRSLRSNRQLPNLPRAQAKPPSGRQTMRVALVLSLLTLVGVASAMAADLPGSKDPPGFKRYEGSAIIHTAQRPYSEYKLNR